MKALRVIMKLLTSGELVELLDKNKNGKIEWSEIIHAPVDVYIEIVFKYGLLIIPILL